MSRLYALLLVTGVLAGCSAVQPAPRAAVTDLSLKRLAIGDARLTVEVATDDTSRAQGLSDRAGLPEGRGMLFTFDMPGRYEFWMNRMRFNLDFLWLAQGRVVEVVANVPAPTPQAPEPARVTPHQPVDAVIEVPAGWAARHDVGVGSVVEGLP